MENIAVAIEKSTRRIIYVATNSAILPKTEELDRYLADPRYQVIMDIQTAKAGRVRTLNQKNEIVEIPLPELDQRVYRVNLGWSSDMFIPGRETGPQVEAVTGIRDRVAVNQPAVLELTTDARDVSPINGIPEILADGQSRANIFISKKSFDGAPLTGDNDNDVVLLQTTRGTLSQRRIRLERGQARVKLRSSTDTVVADVTAWGENLKRYMIHIEFASPPEEKEK